MLVNRTLVLVAIGLSMSWGMMQDAPSLGVFDDYEALLEEGVLPSSQAVRQARQRALSALEEGNCELAVSLLDEWIRGANALANLIAQGLEPFYGATFDDREEFSNFANRIRLLSPIEDLANDYISQRNHAMVMKAECLVALGEPVAAAATYAAALDTIDISDWDWWVRAANGLYGVIGVDGIGVGQGSGTTDQSSTSSAVTPLVDLDLLESRREVDDRNNSDAARIVNIINEAAGSNHVILELEAYGAAESANSPANVFALVVLDVTEVALVDENMYRSSLVRDNRIEFVGEMMTVGQLPNSNCLARGTVAVTIRSVISRGTRQEVVDTHTRCFGF